MSWIIREATEEEDELESSNLYRDPEFPAGWWVGPLLGIAMILAAAAITAIIF